MNADLQIIEKYLWKNKIVCPTIDLSNDTRINSMLDNAGKEEKSPFLSTPNIIESIVPYDLKLSLLSSLIQSPGFLLLKFNPDSNDEDLRFLYAIFCRSLGLLNNRYGYFFDVIDQGLDYTKEAIPVSKTKASTGFHTDSTAKEYLPDIIGLLCLQAGHRGGESQITNAANLYKYLKNNFPEVLIELSKPLIRDVITPGTVNNLSAILKNDFPVFSITDNKFIFRYMRFWIESAHQKTGKPLHEKVLAGLNEIDSFFSRDENLIQFKMNRGEILFLNNCFLCHSRTNFEDAPEHNIIRRMVRAWINLEV